MSLKFRNLDRLFIASALVASVALMASNAEADVIGVSFDNSSTPGDPTFGPTGLAGAPGVRVANWNPWYHDDFVMGDDGQTVVDDSGSAVAGFTATLAGTDRWSQRPGGEGSNDPLFFRNVIDVFGDPKTVDVVGVPYDRYDLYVYMHDDTDGRAGSFTVGDTTYYARGLSPGGSEGAADPADDGTGYVLSTDTTLGDATDIDQGNYVVFSGLTGANFTLGLDAINAGNLDRNKVAGFQIVSVIPEPTSMALAMLFCGVGVFRHRRR